MSEQQTSFQRPLTHLNSSSLYQNSSFLTLSSVDDKFDLLTTNWRSDSVGIGFVASSADNDNLRSGKTILDKNVKYYIKR
jgi:hypothetical protein